MSSGTLYRLSGISLFIGLVSAIGEHVMQLQGANGLDVFIEAPANVPLLDC